MAEPRLTTTARGTLVAAAVSGVLYGLGAMLPQVDGPDVETATASQIRAFLAENDSSIRIAAAGAVVAMVLILVFTVSVARLIRLREPGSPLADLVVAGGVLVAIWHWVVVAASWSTLVQRLDGTDLATVDDATLRGWYGLSNFGHLFGDLGMVGMVAVVGGGSLAALRTGILGRWLAWLGLVVSGCGLLGTLAVVLALHGPSNIWLVAIFGWFIWVLASGVTCGLRARKERKTGAATVAVDAI